LAENKLHLGSWSWFKGVCCQCWRAKLDCNKSV